MGGVQIEAINRRAVARYGAFWSALVMVGEAVAQARKVAEGLGDLRGAKRGLATASGDEIRSGVKAVERSLGVLSKSAQRWEAELKSREWRV
ncbi:MAG: hypothetical protein ACRDRP_06585 [Pseudonocardiaceae bacterium]